MIVSEFVFRGSGGGCWVLNADVPVCNLEARRGEESNMGFWEREREGAKPLLEKESKVSLLFSYTNYRNCGAAL